MYIVRQTKNIPFGLKEITHKNIPTLEEAIERAKAVGAKCVEKITMYVYGKEICVPVWYNEEV